MNKVFIATSLDGFISDRNNGLEWLDAIPNPDKDSMGYYDFMDGIDALVMGRTTFETVLGFGIEWPYTKPVYVLSSSLQNIPAELTDKVFSVKGTLSEVLATIHSNGHHNLYIDGGKTIQSFLNEDLIDELVISTFPILLGGGASLFGETTAPLNFELVDTKVHLGQIVKNHYKRVR